LNKRFVITACALAASTGLALAKLPAPDAAAKAKAAETAAKATWQSKVDAYKLCQVQDRIAAQYRKSGGSRAAVNVPANGTVKTAAAPAAPASPTPATPSNAANPTTASQGGGTPVATVAAAPTIPPCSDPGPFAYNPPPQIPLETSGAHSPAGNAATPPSVRPESAKMAPAGPATPQSKKP